MTATMMVFLSILLITFFCQSAFAAENIYQWPTDTPDSQGMCAEKLNALRDTLAAKDTATFLVIRHDYIIYEWYAPEYNSTKCHYTASLAKALVGGVSLMVAMNEGLIDPDDLACKYVPEWKDDPKKSKITIRQLATHSSGVEDAEADGLPHDKLPGWKGAFWRKEPDPFTISRDQAPIIFEPGSENNYSNTGMAMLAYCVTAALKDSDCPDKDLRALLKNRVMTPIGAPEGEWHIGYGTTYKVNDLDLVANWGGGSYTAQAVARVGRLLLEKGNWLGQQLISEDVVKKATTYAGTPSPSGLCWWVNQNPDGTKCVESLPPDAFWGSGAQNQILLVIPSLDLIVVRNGDSLNDVSKGESSLDGLEKKLFNPLMEAINGAPYPQSEVITSAEFVLASEIIRKGEGSDNWPLTWADDDNMYTAYGDGWGFVPWVKEKLSLGFGKVVGSPPDIKGINIRSETGEDTGDDVRGAKASGMLMVDGILYMLTRNTDNSQIAYSKDHGETWIWCDWKFTTSFGYPTFLNFGKNYAGARDDYVYVYSHDSDSAYKPAVDNMVLARVPKDQIIKREAYEFFKELDGSGAPIWTKDVDQRGSIFDFKGRCIRSSVSYNPGLKRYLYWQVLPRKDMRFDSGFGIYDAPEPWGPWTTVFFTERWDVGPGETGCIPTKWMSEDGKTCYLVYSGDDYFAVRKVTFTTK